MKSRIVKYAIFALAIGILLALALYYNNAQQTKIYSLERQIQKHEEVLERYKIDYELLYDGVAENIENSDLLHSWLIDNNSLEQQDKDFLLQKVDEILDYSSDVNAYHINRNDYTLAIHWYMISYDTRYQIKYALAGSDTIDFYLEGLATGIKMDANMTGRRIFPKVMIVKIPQVNHGELSQQQKKVNFLKY